MISVNIDAEDAMRTTSVVALLLTGVFLAGCSTSRSHDLSHELRTAEWNSSGDSEGLADYEVRYVFYVATDENEQDMADAIVKLTRIRGERSAPLPVLRRLFYEQRAPEGLPDSVVEAVKVRGPGMGLGIQFFSSNAEQADEDPATPMRTRTDFIAWPLPPIPFYELKAEFESNDGKVVIVTLKPMSSREAVAFSSK